MSKPRHEAGSERNIVLFGSRPTGTVPSSQTDTNCQESDDSPTVNARGLFASHSWSNLFLRQEGQRALDSIELLLRAGQANAACLWLAALRVTVDRDSTLAKRTL